MKIFGLLALAAVAGSAVAQQSFNIPNGAVTTTWQNFNLGLSSAAANRYLVITDWVGGGINSQWSSEARSTLSSTAGTGTGTTPTYGAGNVAYQTNTSGATNSAGTGNNATIWWTGNLANNIAAGAPVFFNRRQSFAGTNANWTNTTVVLNPVNNIVTTTTGAAAPTTFTNIGNIDPVGGSIGGGGPVATLANNVTAAGSAVNWFKFTLTSAVDSTNALDMFTTQGTATTAFDTRVIVWRSTPSGLLPIDVTNTSIGNDDDDGTGNFSAVSFGSTNTTLGNRAYAQTTGVSPGLLAFDGRDGGLAAGEYFISVAQFTANSTLTSVTGATTRNLDGNGNTIGLNSSITNTWSMGTTTTYGQYDLTIGVVPAPGALALVGLGGLVAGRRRRA